MHLTAAQAINVSGTGLFRVFGSGGDKLVLEDTDYNASILNEANPIEIVVLKKKCKEKLMNEIQYMLGQSTQPLTGFLERMLHGYQIENVVGMIEGLKNEQPLDLLDAGGGHHGSFVEAGQGEGASQ